MVACLVVTQMVKVRFLPPQMQTEGQAYRRRHPPGTRTRRKPLQVRLLSLPLDTRLCSWESSRSPKPAEWVRILPTLLNFGPGTGRRGNRLIRGTRQVRLLPARLYLPSPLGRGVGGDSLVEQPGVLATLTWWRSLVRIQPRLFEKQAAGSRQQAAGSRQQAAGSRQQAAKIIL